MGSIPLGQDVVRFNRLMTELFVDTNPPPTALNSIRRGDNVAKTSEELIALRLSTELLERLDARTSNSFNADGLDEDQQVSCYPHVDRPATNSAEIT
jgi:hypothetical protein